MRTDLLSPSDKKLEEPHDTRKLTKCLAFNVRQDGRSLALDPLDPARRAGNEFERKKSNFPNKRFPYLSRYFLNLWSI